MLSPKTVDLCCGGIKKCPIAKIYKNYVLLSENGITLKVTKEQLNKLNKEISKVVK